MNITTAYENRRILVIDDNESIHEDFRRILCVPPRQDELAATEAELFGEGPAEASGRGYEVMAAGQGADGLALVKKAVEEGAPFAVAFVDARMPPGWDGIETIERIWQVDPRLQVVLCTAFSDYSWQQIVQRLGQSDRLLILKKPFDIVEVQQLALTLSTKWNLARGAEGQQAALEAAVEMRTRQLTKARVAAETASRAKSQWLASIGREVHPPMNAIMQLAKSLEEQGDLRKAPPARVRAIHTILRNGRQLLALVNNVLDFCRIEAGKLELARAEFDLHEVADKAVRAFADAAAEKSLELTHTVEAGVPREVVGDPQRLERILCNLLDNAVKYTERGSVSVRVGVEKDLDSSCLVRFSVGDTGPGIELEQMEGIFQAFSRVDSPEMEAVSAGLGLAVSKRLAELHGGDIGATSMPGEGSTFWFTLAFQRCVAAVS